MLHELIAQDIDPRDSGFTKFLDEIISKGGKAAKAAQFVKDNLDKLESDDVGARAPLPSSTGARKPLMTPTSATRTATLPPQIDASEIASRTNELTGRIIDEVFNVALRDADPKKVAENQYRDIVESAQAVMQSEDLDNMGEAGRAEFNDHLAEVLAQAIRNETDPGQLQGLMDFANEEIKDGMFDGVSEGLKEGVQAAVGDAGDYLTQLKTLVTDAATGITSVGGQVIRDGMRGGNGGVGNVKRLPGSDFAALSKTLDENALDA